MSLGNISQLESIVSSCDRAVCALNFSLNTVCSSLSDVKVQKIALKVLTCLGVVIAAICVPLALVKAITIYTAFYIAIPSLTISFASFFKNNSITDFSNSEQVNILRNRLINLSWDQIIQKCPLENLLQHQVLPLDVLREKLRHKFLSLKFFGAFKLYNEIFDSIQNLGYNNQNFLTVLNDPEIYDWNLYWYFQISSMPFCEIKNKINFAHLLRISSFNKELAQLCIHLDKELNLSMEFLESSLNDIKVNYHKELHLFKHNFQAALDSAEDEFMSGWSPQILSDLESYYSDLLAGAKSEYDETVSNLDREISNLYKKLFSFSNNLNEKILINQRISQLKNEKILKLQSYLNSKNQIDREFLQGRKQRALSISQAKRNRDKKTQLAKFFLDLQSRDIDKKRDDSLVEVRKRFAFFKERIEQRYKKFFLDHPFYIEV